MPTTAALAEQLRILCGEPDRGDRFAASFDRLAQLVARAVPSCRAVSITVVSLGTEITFDITIRPGGSAPVLASLAVPLSAGDSGAVLVLRAADAGAFVPLAAHLRSRPGGGPPATLDSHLYWPRDVTAGSLAAALADLRAVNQAIGVLIDRGWEPLAAEEELRRRADDANITIGAASRLVLDPRPPRAA